MDRKVRVAPFRLLPCYYASLSRVFCLARFIEVHELQERVAAAIQRPLHAAWAGVHDAFRLYMGIAPLTNYAFATLQVTGLVEGILVGVTNTDSVARLRAAINSFDLENPDKFQALFIKLSPHTASQTMRSRWYLNSVTVGDEEPVGVSQIIPQTTTILVKFGVRVMRESVAIILNGHIVDEVPVLSSGSCLRVAFQIIHMRQRPRANTLVSIRPLSVWKGPGGLEHPLAGCSLCVSIQPEDAVGECWYCRRLFCNYHGGRCASNLCSFVGCILCLAVHPHT